MAAVIQVILEPRKIKFVTVSTFPPSICYEVMELDATVLSFFVNAVFKPAFSLFSFTLKKLFNSSLLSTIKSGIIC